MLPDSIVPQPPVFDALAAFGIGGLAVLVALAWVAVFARGDVRCALVLGAIASAVMAVSAFAAASGVLARFESFPPPMLVMMVSVIVAGFAGGLSSFGHRAAVELPFLALVGLQSFRFPLELVMHHAGNRGIMPTELSYSGYNFDIVTGIGAAVIFVILRSGHAVPSAVLWAWNLWGSLCLAVIAFIAVATSPIVRLFGDEPQHLNTWVLYFPYVWLPVVMVTIAIFGHVVVTRKLVMKPTI